MYNATSADMVKKIIRKEKRRYEITIANALDECEVIDTIPPDQNFLFEKVNLSNLNSH